jgi:hypothetical protein
VDVGEPEEAAQLDPKSGGAAGGRVYERLQMRYVEHLQRLE